MGSLRDVSIGDILTALGRYRPVVFTVGAILVALLILPKPEGLASTAAGGSTIETPPDTSVVAAPGTTPPDTVAAGDAGASPAFTPSTGSSFTGSDSSSSSSFSSGSGFSSSDTTATTTFEPSSDAFVPSSTSDSASGPLRIVSKTWATRTSGTPLAKDGVPDGTLPVGVRVQDDKLSFVRLSGDELVLNLVEAPGGRANQGTVSVQACPITTSDWKDGEAIAIGDIGYDTGNCAQGVRGANGIWQFDLGKFAARSGGNGFALVPGEDAGLDYQVNFKLS